MPAAGNKNKGKARETRRSGSRNTTPNSGSAVVNVPAGYLQTDISQLVVPPSIQYSEVIEKLNGAGQIPDVKALESLLENFQTLIELADTRGNVSNMVMRELSQKRKDLEREMIEREAGERLKVKVEVEDEEGVRASKGGKLKKKKDKTTAKEDRPLAHGAHAMARQDGSESMSRSSSHDMPEQCVTVANSNLATPSKHKTLMLTQQTTTHSHTLSYCAYLLTMELTVPQKRKDASEATSPPPKKAKNAPSGESSPLPQAVSPAGAKTREVPSAAESPESEDYEDHQPEPAPEVPQYHVFGPDPLRFPDPTVYHIREVTPGMTDEEKKEIFSVADFPRDDLLHMMAGPPPDKDFSNTKPANQVSANTFATYIDSYVRPLTEEDINFLKEKVGETMTM